MIESKEWLFRLTIFLLFLGVLIMGFVMGILMDFYDSSTDIPKILTIAWLLFIGIFMAYLLLTPPNDLEIKAL